MRCDGRRRGRRRGRTGEAQARRQQRQPIQSLAAGWPFQRESQKLCGPLAAFSGRRKAETDKRTARAEERERERERERGQREKRRRERKLKARRRCCRWRGHAHGSEAWAQTIGVSGTEESGDHSSPPSSRPPGLARLARNPLVAGALVATASAELSCLGVGGDGRAAAAAGFGHASPEHGHRLRERGGVAVSFSLPARPKIPPFRFF